jgi:hypothetical protein
MRLVSKQKQLSAGQEKWAVKVAGQILLAQRKTADYLNDRTAKVSAKSWLIVLIVLCGITGTYLIYLLSQVFKN